MPAYNTVSPPYSASDGDIAILVNNEQLGAGKTSQQVAISQPYGLPHPVSLTFSYAGVPAAVSYDIQVANEDVDSAYIKVGNTTNVNGDRVDINTMSGGLKFKFVRVKEVTPPGVNATVKLLG